MHDVFFYRDEKDKSLIADYLQDLSAKGDKDSRIKLNKIYQYTKYLSQTAGTRAICQTS